MEEDLIMMLEQELQGNSAAVEQRPERLLIISIIAVAVKDIVNHPPLDLLDLNATNLSHSQRIRKKKYVNEIANYHSAIQFLKVDNYMFQQYCTMIDVNHEYALEKIWENIVYLKNNPHEKFRLLGLPG